MPNRKYEAGRRKEYKIRNQLLKEGYDIAQRTAGSHSPIDVIAISKDKRKIIFVQSKGANFRDYEKRKIEKELDWLNGEFKSEFILI